MAKIILKTPNSDYQVEVDTGVTEVEIHEAFLGVTFVTLSGKKLAVSMRDDDFEVVFTDLPPAEEEPPNPDPDAIG